MSAKPGELLGLLHDQCGDRLAGIAPVVDVNVMKLSVATIRDICGSIDIVAGSVAVEENTAECDVGVLLVHFQRVS